MPANKIFHLHAADLLFALLHKMGVKRIYGIPGDELEIFDALAHSDIEFVTSRHEQAAAFMAAAEGKVSSLPGFCISTLGPGAANLVTGVADAYQNRAPVVVLSGQLGTKYLRNRPLAHQYIDLQRLFGPITKATYVIRSVRDIPSVIRKAVTLSLSGRPGPVHVTLPIDVMESAVLPRVFKSRIKLSKPKTKPPLSSLSRAVKLITESRFPVAFLGQGALSADPVFRAALKQANIPAMTSFLGKGSFPENHALSLGTVSRHLKDRLTEVVDQANLFLVVNYDYIEGVDPVIFSGKKIVSLDYVSAGVDKLLRPELELVGDVGGLCSALGERLRKKNYQADWQREYLQEVRRQRLAQVLAVQDLASYPYNPFYVMQVLQSALTGDEIIVSDVGNHKQAIGVGYNITKPLGVHFSNGLSSMGFSVPFAAGLRFNTPASKKIIVICGDGGFLMNVQELETLVRYKLDVKIMVFVDNAFGMIKSNLLNKYQRVKNLDFTNPDWPHLAKSFGLKHFSVSKPKELRSVIKSFASSGGTALLTVPVKYT